MTTSAPTATQSAAGFLSLQGLSKRYGDFVAVDAADLDVRQGEFVSLLGPSGCGKTTTLRMIAGLVTACGGKIVVGGRDLTEVPPYRRDMGLVFQSYALFPHMSVAGNIAFGLKMRGLPRTEVDARVAEAIALVRLEGRESRRPSELSGGQQQRVALARALAIRPSIMLLDEPLSNLDAKLRDEMRIEIRDIQRRLGITAIFVTHDQDEALTMSDRVVVMNHGRIVQIGTPEDLYERPRTPFVAGFVGRTNRFDGMASGDAIRLGGTTICGNVAASGPVQVLIRPHRVSLTIDAPAATDGLNLLAGAVLRTTYAGNLVQYEVAAAGLTFQIEQSTQGAGRAIKPGTAVHVAWTAQDTLVFEATP